jgi:hypothetical protein
MFHKDATKVHLILKIKFVHLFDYFLDRKQQLQCTKGSSKNIYFLETFQTTASRVNKNTQPRNGGSLFLIESKIEKDNHRLKRKRFYKTS